jgi:hypothetical protein
LLLATVGFSELFQQTPLEVTSAFPSLVTFPPDVAVVCVIPVTMVVVTTGRVGFGLQEVRNTVRIIKSTIIMGILAEGYIVVFFGK